MSNIKVVELKEVSTELSPYCHFARPEDHISVTEWSNGALSWRFKAAAMGLRQVFAVQTNTISLGISGMLNRS